MMQRARAQKFGANEAQLKQGKVDGTKASLFPFAHCEQMVVDQRSESQKFTSKAPSSAPKQTSSQAEPAQKSFNEEWSEDSYDERSD